MSEAPSEFLYFFVFALVVSLCRIVYSIKRQCDNSSSTHQGTTTTTVSTLNAAAISRQQQEFRAIQQRREHRDRILRLQAQQRQQQLERSDQNAGPIHPHSNFIVEERQQRRSNNDNIRNLTQADLLALIPKGVSNSISGASTFC